MSGALIAAVSAVLVALLGGGGLAALLNRRNTGRLAVAQAANMEATTMDLVQRITRSELERLEHRIAEVEQRAERAEARAAVSERELEHQQHISRAAFSYIERLLDYIAGHGGRETPPMPVELADYIGGGGR